MKYTKMLMKILYFSKKKKNYGKYNTELWEAGRPEHIIFNT